MVLQEPGESEMIRFAMGNAVCKPRVATFGVEFSPRRSPPRFSQPNTMRFLNSNQDSWRDQVISHPI